MALNLLSIFNTNNCKVNVVTLQWTSPSVFLNEVCDLFPGRELFNSKWRLLWKLSDEKIPENPQMSQTLWIRRKSLLSHHPAFSTGICQHQTAFPSTLPSMEIDDEEGFLDHQVAGIEKSSNERQSPIDQIQKLSVWNFEHQLVFSQRKKKRANCKA